MKRFECHNKNEPMNCIQVGNKTLCIGESAQDYSLLFEEALRRNLDNPTLPYFSAEDLAKDEILVSVDTWSTQEHNYDIGKYRSYHHKIFCGNLCVDTSLAKLIKIDTPMISWTRSFDWCEFCVPNYCETDEERETAKQEAIDNAKQFLDAFETDLLNLNILSCFANRCQTVQPNKYKVDNFSIWRHSFIYHGNRQWRKEKIVFRIYENDCKSALQYKTFAEMQELINLSDEGFLSFLENCHFQ